jgi:hypothetical protein
LFLGWVAEEKDPVVFTGLETIWVTVDKVGIPTLGLDGTGPTRPPTLAPAPEGSGIMEETFYHYCFYRGKIVSI